MKTEARQVDEATAVQEVVARTALLASIVDSCDDAIYGETPEGIITSWNQAAEKIYGYAASEIIGRPVSLIAPADRPAEMDQILARIRRGERIEHYETRRRRKDGRIISVSLTVSPILDSHGTLIGASSIARDITERKLAEEQIASPATLLARGTLSCRFTFGVLAVTVPGLVLIAVVTVSSMRSLAIADRQLEEITFSLAAATELRAVLRHVDGPVRDYLLRNREEEQRAFDRMLTAAQDRLVACAAATCHVTAKLTPKEMAGSLAPKVALLQRKGRLIFESAAADGGTSRLKELEEVDALERSISLQLQFMSDRLSERVSLLREQSLRLHNRVPLLTVLVAIGVIVLGSVSSALLAKRISRPIRELLFGIRRVREGDSAHRIPVTCSGEIGEVAASFNAMVNEITEKGLALARSNAELEQFAYVASHDLQEPLRMVSSYVQLFAKRYQGQLDPQADKYIHYAVEGATRMQALIAGLLEYSRLSQQARSERVETSDVLQFALANLKSSVEDSGAVVTYDPLPPVVGDFGQLVQVFQNLLSNALKFRRQGEVPRVHVSAARDGSACLFQVRDNGIGMENKYIDRIFVIFQRLHSRAEYPGTGIGLSVCKKIVEKHGGRIWVESELGKGSTFFFALEAA